MGKKYEFKNEEIIDIINMYVIKLEPIYKISKKYNVSDDVICKRLRDNNIKIAKGSAYSVNYWLQRGLNVDEAKEHIKKLRPVNKEYWINIGYSEKESINKTKTHSVQTLEGCILKYGVIEGEKKWGEIKIKRREWSKLSNTSLSYWIKLGYSKEEAIKLRSERQSTFSLNKCIEKYGLEKGKEVFTKRQLKWSDSLSKGGNLKIGYSKISQELFYSLLDIYDIKDRDEIFFGSHNKEFRLNKNGGGLWLYDFTDNINKKIIEFNGDLFHANPNKFNTHDKPNPFNKNITSKEIWDKDKEKIRVAEVNGFKVLTIWDSEYRWGSKKKVFDRCVEFLIGFNDNNLNKNVYE